MNTLSQKDDKKRSLEILGIDDDEEIVYRWLLTHPGASIAEVASGLFLPRAKTQRLLEAVEIKGLTTHTPERPRRYLATSPDIGLEALVLQHQERLKHVRATIDELQQYAESQHNKRGNERVVEMIASREAESQLFADMHRSAQHEILTLTRPPLRVTRLNTEAEALARLQEDAQTRGVIYRSIVDTEFLASPGASTRIRREHKSGEIFRTTPALPFKMVLADRRIAIVPLHLEQPDSASLLIRSSALLDALQAMFEMLWSQAAPLVFTSSGHIETGDAETEVGDQVTNIVSLMAAGLNDKTISRELKISSSTLNRRIARLMSIFHARTRFQLGWIARGKGNKSEHTENPRAGFDINQS